MTTIIDEQSVSPQHLRMYFADGTPIIPAGSATPRPPNAGRPGTNILTIYTGSVGINWGTGRGRAGEVYLMPVLGLFPGTAGAGPVKGIFPLVPGELVAATAMVGLTDLVDKTDVAVFQIRAVTADVQAVTLRPNIPIRAVVLTCTIEGQNSEVDAFHYQVTVLTRVADISRDPKAPPALLAPIVIGQAFVGQTWSGGFTSISSTGPGLMMGQPQAM